MFYFYDRPDLLEYNETFADNEENLIKIVGTIHNEPGKDVLNEIDVLSLKGKVVLFISCKTGKMGQQQALHAFYELQTVADRFGDKYSKKVLVTARPLGDVYMERVGEMGIEVR